MSDQTSNVAATPSRSRAPALFSWILTGAAVVAAWIPYSGTYEGPYALAFYGLAALLGLYPLLRVVHSIGLQRTLLAVLAWILAAGSIAALKWAFDHPGGNRIWGFVAAAVLAVFPLFSTVRWFARCYLPYLTGEAIYDPQTGKCVNKKWIPFDDTIFWIFVSPGALLCYGLVHWGVPAGWVFISFWVWFLLIRRVVEQDLKEEDVKGFLVSWISLILAGLVSNLQFKWNPLASINVFAMKQIPQIVQPGFYLFMAILFLGLSLYQIVARILLQRHESDGSYLTRVTLTGAFVRDQLWTPRVSTKPDDVLETLFGSRPLRVFQGDRLVVNHDVIFFGGHHQGRTDFDDLFTYETAGERRAGVGGDAAEPIVANLRTDDEGGGDNGHNTHDGTHHV